MTSISSLPASSWSSGSKRIATPEVLRSISIPTLFITGGEDTTYPPFLSDALAPLMSNATVEQVPDSGHSVYFQRAGIFNRLVEDFLSKVG